MAVTSSVTILPRSPENFKEINNNKYRYIIELIWYKIEIANVIINAQITTIFLQWLKQQMVKLNVRKY